MSENIKEIDLIALVIHFFQFCKEKFIVLLIAGIIGGVAGATVYCLLPVYYKYEISAVATEIPAEAIQKTINSSDMFFKSRAESLFKELEMPEVLLKKIKSISASVESDNSQQLNISLVVSENISEENAELLLFSILNRNDYIHDMLKIKQDQAEKIIGFLDNQIENYDKLPAQFLSEDGILIQGEETPTDLFLKRKEYEYKLNYLQPLVIDNFPVLPESTKSSVVLFGVIGWFILTGLLFVYYVVIKINKMVINLEKENLSIINYSKTA